MSQGLPKRARSWKRRIQPRKTYSASGSPLLGKLLRRLGQKPEGVRTLEYNQIQFAIAVFLDNGITQLIPRIVRYVSGIQVLPLEFHVESWV